MSQALLLGRDHLELGAIGAISEGVVAIAISKGGAPKNYQHTDPNEDAAAFAIGEGGVFVAVADGHNGAEGAEVALRHLLQKHAAPWTAADSPLRDESMWHQELRNALVEINTEILRDAARRSAPPPGSTLSIAVARPGDDRLIHAAIGDSPLFALTGGGGLVDLGFGSLSEARARYLGHRAETAESIRESCAVASRSLRDVRAIVLATDGLSEVGIGVIDPAGAVVEITDQAALAAPELRSLETARNVVETANSAHRENRAGDNAAAAAVWLDHA